MAFAYPGPTNVYIPTVELSGNLNINFTRNQKDFPVNKLIKLIPVTKEAGFYRYFNPNDEARVSGPISSGIVQQNVWAPGNMRPINGGHTRSFENRAYATLRRSFDQTLELRSTQQADFDLLRMTTDGLGRDAMTDRAIEAAALVTASASYPSTHVDTATNFGGGFWSAGTAANPYIKKTMFNLANKIFLDSAGNVKQDNLVLVMNPNTARQVATSQEVHTIFTNTAGLTDKLLTMQGAVGPKDAIYYGVPENLYGSRVVIEDTTYVPYNRGSSSEVQAYVFPDNTAAMISVEKEFVGSEAAMTYSTFSMFVYSPDDFKIETFTDQKNRLMQILLTDNRQVLATAGVTGGLITNLFS
jgi:hypothetical protein